MSVLLFLPWPPSLNKLWRAIGGRILLSEAARQYQRKLNNALPKGRVVPLRGRLKVTMTLHAPPDVPHYDIANREKCLFDGLTKQRVWLDDGQIDELTIRRGEPWLRGGVELMIEPYDCATL